MIEYLTHSLPFVAMPSVSLSDLIRGVSSGEHLITFPTDTVPALASHPDRGDLIYVAKQRSQDKPLILMGATLTDLLPYVVGSDADIATWRQVTDQYWPGPLTLVLPASDRIPPTLNPQQTGTIGIRVPNHPLARYLLARTGPLATTSANRSGQPPLETVEAILQQFPTVLALSTEAAQAIHQDLRAEGIDPNRPPSGVPSTVAQWVGDGWKILRQGGVVLAT